MALDMDLVTDQAMVMPSPPMATLDTPLATVLMVVDFTSVRLMPRLPTMEAMVLDMEPVTDQDTAMPSPPMATLDMPLAMVLMVVDFTSVRLMPRLPTMEATVLDPMVLDMDPDMDLAMVMPSPPMATLDTPLATGLMGVDFTSVRQMPRLPTMEAMVLDPMAMDMDLVTDQAMAMPSPPMATLDTPLAMVLMAMDFTSVRLMPRLRTMEATVLDPMALDMEPDMDLAMVMLFPPMATLVTPLVTVPMAVPISFKISTLLPKSRNKEVKELIYLLIQILQKFHCNQNKFHIALTKY